MRISVPSLCFCVLLAGSSVPAAGPLGSGFTYQGNLERNGYPISDTVDFEFTLFDADVDGNPVGDVVAVADVDVVDGLFTVTLDFGAEVFDGEARWLEIAVRSPAGEGAFTTLSPRQPLTAVPYALHALDAPGGGDPFWQQNGNNIFYTDGSVGIGTENPRRHLDILGGGLTVFDSGAQGISFAANTFVLTNADNEDPVYTYNRSDNAHTFFGGDGSPAMTIAGNRIVTMRNNLFFDTQGLVEIAHSNNTGMVIDPVANSVHLEADNGTVLTAVDGRVGIGTTTPSEALDVVGNISASGTVTGDIINTGGQYHINGGLVLSMPGFANIFLGVATGQNNTTGGLNVFFGKNAGLNNTSGNGNTFIGVSTGVTNTTGALNTAVGNGAGVGPGNLTNATAIGSKAQVTQSNSLVLGSINGVNDATADTNVGIGTTTPGERLSVNGIVESTSGGFKFPDGTVQETAGTLTLPFIGSTNTSSAAFRVTNTGAGRAGQFIGTSSSSSSAALTATTFGRGPSLEAINFGNDGPAGLFKNLSSSSTSPAIVAETLPGTAPAIQAIGGIITDELEITGGGDVAEPFDISGERTQPGTVVVIDPDSPGKLMTSKHAYDRRVAGVISGAGGVRPGLRLGQKGSIADGEHDVALAGRVYCWCDASNGPIEPGDLLTTSDVAGHAMKVTDFHKAPGAVIGKAMTPLSKGRGLVLILVNLQ